MCLGAFVVSNSASLRAIALMGATGTGKSALAMQLAKDSGGGIISCDSMQVYQGLGIGTAKPDAIEQKAVPHFLIDGVALPHIYSAAQWAKDAANIIRQENEAGRTPLIVGGTGLYLRALLEGFSDIPPEDKGVRRHLEEKLAKYGVQAMHRSLEICDAATAARLSPNDTQRIMRALAVFETTGRPLSEWVESQPKQLAVDCPVFVLDADRDVLRARLSERFHAMMAEGWIDEVRWLAGLNLPDAHPAVRAVGYRQLLKHVRGECTLEEAISEGITATRRYAKRQATWFRHQTPDAVWGDADELRQRIAGL